MIARRAVVPSRRARSTREPAASCRSSSKVARCFTRRSGAPDSSTAWSSSSRRTSVGAGGVEWAALPDGQHRLAGRADRHGRSATTCGSKGLSRASEVQRSMFTGLVESLGQDRRRSRQRRPACGSVSAPTLPPALVPGESVAVNGVCLTVVEAGGGRHPVRRVAGDRPRDDARRARGRSARSTSSGR